MNNGRGNLQKALSKFCDSPTGPSELDSVSVKNARWPLGLPPGGHFLNPNTPPRHSYHSRWVIARSGSGTPLNHEWRTLARATSGSLTTRIPKVLELNAGVRRSCCASGAVNRRIAAPFNSGTFGRVGVRATSKERTYRRSGVESEVDELRKNRGSKLKRPVEGKSCSVSESRKNSFLGERKIMEGYYYILQDRLGEYVEKIESTNWETVKYVYLFTKEKEKARVFSYNDLYNRQDVLPIGVDFQRGFQGNVIRVDK